MSEPNKFDKDLVDSMLGLLDHYREQFKLQREVLDRWFRFYLLIVAVLLATFAAAVKSGSVGLTHPDHQQFLGLCCFFLTLLGVSFFYMNMAQRTNSVGFVSKSIIPLEKAIWTRFGKAVAKPARSFKPRPFGADFAVGVVIALTVAAWFVGAVALLCEKFADYPYAVGGGLFAATIVALMLVRGLYLKYYPA